MSDDRQCGHLFRLRSCPECLRYLNAKETEMQFDFENLEPWEVSTSTLLPVGNHVVTINGVESSKTSNGNNQLVIEGSNDKGSRKDWIVYAEENGARKVVALCQATGVRLPTGDDQDESGKLSDAYCALFVGKQGGMVVREETYQGKTNPRVKGWVHPSQVEADMPADVPATSAVEDDDDIPF